jgi:hypothetical protein
MPADIALRLGHCLECPPPGLDVEFKIQLASSDELYLTVNAKCYLGKHESKLELASHFT